MAKELNYETDGEVFIKHPENVRLGENVFIGHGTFIDGYHEGPGIDIGDGTWIGQMCYLHGAGGIHIGDNVGVGPCSKIFTSFHQVHSIGPIIHAPLVFKRVFIDDECDIGIGAIVLPGAFFCSGVQIGAGATVGGKVLSNRVITDRHIRKDYVRFIRDM